ncbi:MAG TPA: TrkH family potassium uptake protein, partial [Burkholderiaceae bacterium]|nr:TrkH family potassium uptake protein [Burkholderiaceae bacterium]
MTALVRSTLPVFNVLGYVVLMFAATMLVPLAFAVVADDGSQRGFDIALLATAVSGLVLTLATRRFRRELQVRDGFLLVTL